MTINLKAKLSAYSRLNSDASLTEASVSQTQIDSLFPDINPVQAVTYSDIDTLFTGRTDVIVGSSEIDNLFTDSAIAGTVTFDQIDILFD